MKYFKSQYYESTIVQLKKVCQEQNSKICYTSVTVVLFPILTIIHQQFSAAKKLHGSLEFYMSPLKNTCYH